MTKQVAALAVGLALALGACASTPKANVLRFHQGPPPQGTVYIQPANPGQAGGLEFQAQATAVGAEMARVGLKPVGTPAGAQFTATVGMQTAERMGPPRNSGVQVGIGGGVGGGGGGGFGGIGGSVMVPVGGSGTGRVATTTTLSVALVANPGGQAVWEGRASLDTEAGGMRGTPLAPVLAQAMFKDFPGPSGQTVQVPIR
jgi:hypothetical protein